MVGDLLAAALDLFAHQFAGPLMVAVSECFDQQFMESLFIAVDDSLQTRSRCGPIVSVVNAAGGLQSARPDGRKTAPLFIQLHRDLPCKLAVWALAPVLALFRKKTGANAQTANEKWRCLISHIAKMCKA